MTEAAVTNERSSNLLLPAVLLIAAVFAWVAPTLRWLEFSNGAENLNVATALEMRRGGPWLVPTLQGELRIAKPPLTAWITAAFINPRTVRDASSPDAMVRDRAFQQLAWQVRWPALLTMCLMLLAVYGLGRAVGDDTLGLISVAVCASSLMFLRYARFSTTDVELALWVTVANWCLAEAVVRKRVWFGFIGAGVALGLAMMSKGPVSLVQSVLPVVLFLFWRRLCGTAAPGCASGEEAQPRAAVPHGSWLLGLLAFFLVALPWFIYVAVEHDVIRRWMQEVTRVGARDTPASPVYVYLAIFVDVLPWIVFFFVGLIVLAQQMKRRERISEALPLFLTFVPLIVMSFFRDRQDRYMLPMIAPAAIIAARGVVEHLRSWSRWNKADTIVTALHWLVLLVLAVGVPIVGATTLLKRVDGTPWFSWIIVAPVTVTAVAFIAVSIYLHRLWRGGLILATFVVMLVLQTMFIFGYANSPDGRAEMRPLAESIATLYPDAEVYNAHPEGQRPPTDLGVYLNRTIPWVADVAKIPASDRQQIVLYRQNQNDPAPKPPADWGLVDVKRRGKDLWYAYIRERK
jgi:4-amino-4-deoxy-L-arabinose transferase-like glycosyltransferase